jgi:CheY-like chemotaxis protein
MDESRLTVLVVDDAPANVHILVNILSPDYRTKIAINGESAMKIAQKEPHPDLILLDVIMPGMSGHEVCRELKANPDTASIPVLFVTATADEDEVTRGRSLGANGYIVKPLDPKTVLDTVRRTIGGPRT